MTNGRFENIGFLCRWCLLGLVGLGALALAAVGLSGPNMTADKSRLLAPDAVWSAGRDVYMQAFVADAALPSGNTWLMANRTGGEQLVGGCDRNRFDILVPSPQAGRNLVTFKGIPYGPLSFMSRPCQLEILAAGDRPCLVDARLAVKALENGQAGMGELLRRLPAGKHVVLFHGGPAAQAVEAADRLHRGGVELPLVWECRETADWITPCRRLNNQTVKRAADITIVTADQELADKAVSQSFHVMRVGMSY